MKQWFIAFGLVVASLAFGACGSNPPIGIVVAVYAPSSSDANAHYVVELQHTGASYSTPNELLPCAVANECMNLMYSHRVLYSQDATDKNLYHFQAALDPTANR